LKRLYLLRLGLLFSALWALSTQFAHAQATITTAAGGGSWTNAGTWQGGTVPGPLDNVIIQDNVTLNTSTTIASLSVNAGTLQFGNNNIVRILQVNGDVVIQTGGVITANNPGGTPTHQLNFTGDFSSTGGTYTSTNTNGTISNILNGTGTQTISGVNSFDNFTINNGSNTVLAGATTFTGSVTINSGGSLTGGASAVTVSGGGITNNGTLTGGAGIFTFDTTNPSALSGSGTFTVPSITVTGITLNNNASTLTVDTGLEGTGTFVQNSAPSVLNLGGTSGITTLNASLANTTVNYDGTGSQTINGTTTYYNLGILGSGTKTLQASTTAINGATTVSSTLSIAAAASRTFNGQVTINSGGSWSDTGNSTPTFHNGIFSDGSLSAG